MRIDTRKTTGLIGPRCKARKGFSLKDTNCQSAWPHNLSLIMLAMLSSKESSALVFRRNLQKLSIKFPLEI